MIDRLEEQKRNIDRKIEKLQRECSHPSVAVSKDHRSECASGGGYLQYYRCRCSICGKRWDE